LILKNSRFIRQGGESIPTLSFDLSQIVFNGQVGLPKTQDFSDTASTSVNVTTFTKLGKKHFMMFMNKICRINPVIRQTNLPSIVFVLKSIGNF
jgi:hypothetical protein